MYKEVWFFVKCLTTLFVFIGLQTSVDSHMSLEIYLQGESFHIFHTSIGFLSCNSCLIIFECWFLTDFPTSIRLFTCLYITFNENIYFTETLIRKIILTIPLLRAVTIITAYYGVISWWNYSNLHYNCDVYIQIAMKHQFHWVSHFPASTSTVNLL